MMRGYADTPEGQIHYRLEGEGMPLLLLHPGPRSSRYYWKLIPLLAPHYRVVAPDTLGFGGSDPAPHGVTMQVLARSMIHLLDALGIERAHVFGLHTGNKIGTALGVDYPERVGKAILCGMTHSILVDRDARNASIFQMVGHFREAPPPDDDAGLMREWASAFGILAGDWWDDSALTQRERGTDRFRHLEHRVIDILEARAGMPASIHANSAFDLVGEMRRLKVPTLIVELASPAEEHLFGRQGPEVQNLIPGSELTTVENTDEYYVEWNANAIAPIILDYLSR